MASDQTEECPLEECPPGLFLFGETLCFRSEYSTTLKASPYVQPDAYVVESGEYFWGGAKTSAERSALLVRPCDSITPADLAARIAAAVQAEREVCAAGLDAAANMLRLRDAEDRGIPDHMGRSFEANAAEVWAKSIRARGPTPALDAAIKAAYKQGWNDREGDFLAGTARIGIDDAAIKAAREDGMEAAVKIAQADERTYQGYDGCNPALIVPRIIAAIRTAKDQPA